MMKLGMNHPMGPLTLADFIGLDVCLAILERPARGPRRSEVPRLSAAPPDGRRRPPRPEVRPGLLQVLRAACRPPSGSRLALVAWAVTAHLGGTAAVWWLSTLPREPDRAGTDRPRSGASSSSRTRGNAGVAAGGGSRGLAAGAVLLRQGLQMARAGARERAASSAAVIATAGFTARGRFRSRSIQCGLLGSGAGVDWSRSSRDAPAHLSSGLPFQLHLTTSCPAARRLRLPSRLVRQHVALPELREHAEIRLRQRVVIARNGRRGPCHRLAGGSRAAVGRDRHLRRESIGAGRRSRAGRPPPVGIVTG